MWLGNSSWGGHRKQASGATKVKIAIHQVGKVEPNQNVKKFKCQAEELLGPRFSR